MRKNRKHTARAREMFGDDAMAYSERSGRYDDSSRNGKLAGKCSTCYQSECSEPIRFVIAVDLGIGKSIRGHGHTWEAAWEQAERRAGVP